MAKFGKWLTVLLDIFMAATRNRNQIRLLRRRLFMTERELEHVTARVDDAHRRIDSLHNQT